MIRDAAKPRPLGACSDWELPLVSSEVVDEVCDDSDWVFCLLDSLVRRVTPDALWRP